MASLSFIALFADTTNTPVAFTIIGVELFGSENLVAENDGFPVVNLNIPTH